MAVLAGPATLCGLLSGICSQDKGNRNMGSAPVDGNACLVHTTQLGHQFNQEVPVFHVLYLLCVADLTVQDESICCGNVHKVQEQGTVPASSSAVGGVTLDELV